MLACNKILQGKNVIVTGGSGFIGWWMTASLAMLGAKVSAWGQRRETGFSPADFLDLSGPELNPIDLADCQVVRRTILTAQPDLIVHMAAKTSVRACLDNPLDAFQVNAMGTLNILEAVRAIGLRSKIVIASSDLALGNLDPSVIGGTSIDEYQLPDFGEPYGTSKAVAELIAGCYQVSYFNDSPTVAIVRFANVFGYGDPNERRILPQFVLSALTEGIVHLKYRLNGRQFIFITDLILGLLRVCRLLLTGDGSGLTSPLGGPPSVNRSLVFHFALEEYPNSKDPFIRMADLADLISANIGGRVDAAGAIDYASKERKVQALNCARTRELLKWKPSISLSNGISHLAEWYRYLRNSGGPDRNELARIMRNALEHVVQENKPLQKKGEENYGFDK